MWKSIASPGAAAPVDAKPLISPAYVVGGAGSAGAPAAVGIGVPGDDLAGVVEVVLAAPEPGQGALAEGVRDGVGEGARFPSPDLLRPHAAPSLEAPDHL